MDEIGLTIPEDETQAKKWFVAEVNEILTDSTWEDYESLQDAGHKIRRILADLLVE